MSHRDSINPSPDYWEEFSLVGDCFAIFATLGCTIRKLWNTFGHDLLSPEGIVVSNRLEELKKVHTESTVSLRNIDDIFGEEGAPLTIVFLCLPFLFPMPIPGISTAFGFAIILLTFRVLSPRALPLPKIADRIRLNGKTVAMLAEKSMSYAKRVETFLKPRAGYMLGGPARLVVGLSMILSAIALALPIPPIIPFTNTLPALAITFFALGVMMRDGVMVILGHLFHLVSWGYLVSIAGVAFAFAVKGYEYIKPYF